MTDQPKFSRGDRVSVANGIGSHVTGFRVIQETRTVDDIRVKASGVEYRMVGFNYWIPARRVSALRPERTEETAPLVNPATDLRHFERRGAFVI